MPKIDPKSVKLNYETILIPVLTIDRTDDDQETRLSKSTHHRLLPQSATGPIIHSELS